MNKANIIIDAALERYRPVAAERVQRKLCDHCPDRRCESGASCNTYDLLVKATAWAMASGHDSEPGEGGEFGYSAS